MPVSPRGRDDMAWPRQRAPSPPRSRANFIASAGTIFTVPRSVPRSSLTATSSAAAVLPLRPDVPFRDSLGAQTSTDAGQTSTDAGQTRYRRSSDGSTDQHRPWQHISDISDIRLAHTRQWQHISDIRLAQTSARPSQPVLPQGCTPRAPLPACRLLREETTEPSLTSMHELSLLHRLPHYLQHHIVPSAIKDSEQFVIPARIVKDFIEKLCQPCQFSIQTLICAICLVRKAGLFGSSFNEATWQLELLTAVSLTNKMHDDAPLKDSQLRKQFPMLLSKPESLVDCEVIMAERLKWRMQVDAEVFECLCNDVLTLPLEVPMLCELLHLDTVRLPELSNRTLQTLEGLAGIALGKVHAEQRRRHKQAHEENLCCICLEKRRSVVLQPCRHLALCDVCADLHRDLQQPCPQCRGRVEAYLHVYS